MFVPVAHSNVMKTLAMTKIPEWQYDEMVHVGKDFAGREVVVAYDARHRKFRGVERENDAIVAGRPMD